MKYRHLTQRFHYQYTKLVVIKEATIQNPSFIKEKFYQTNFCNILKILIVYKPNLQFHITFKQILLYGYLKKENVNKYRVVLVKVSLL